MSAGHIAGQRTGAPHIAGTAVALTSHRYDQEEVARVLTSVGGPEFARFARTSGVDTRSLALPLSRYPELTGFTEANTAYVEVAVDLGEQAVRSALEAARVTPEEVDAIVMVSSTGVAVPTIDARLASRIGLQAGCQAHPAVRARLRRGCGRDGTCTRLSARLPESRRGAAVGGIVFTHTPARRHVDPRAHRGVSVRRRCGRSRRHRSRLGPSRSNGQSRSDGAGHPKSAVSRHRRRDGLERQLERVRSGDVPRRPAHGRRVSGRGGRPLPGRPRPDHRGHLDLDLSSGRSEGARCDRARGRLAAGSKCA